MGMGCSGDEEKENVSSNGSNSELDSTHQVEELNKALDTTLESTDTNSAVTQNVVFPKTHDDELQTLLVEKASEELGRPVMVIINQRRQLDDWIFLVGAPRELNGAPLDYRSTNFASQEEEQILDDVLLALAHHLAANGTWEIVGFSMGATDAPFFDWSEKFGLPLVLFVD